MEDIDAHKAIRDAIRVGETGAALELIGAKPEHLRAITPFGTWLHVACSFGNLELVTALVEMGADINVRSGVFGGSAINEAASKGHRSIVQYLLEQGAQLDTSDPERNPLFAAIYGGHKEIVALLVSAGINCQIKYTGQSMKDMDAYAFAVERGQKDIASYLESQGCRHGQRAV